MSLKPAPVHLCSWRCRLACWMGNHWRLTRESRCRCCDVPPLALDRMKALEDTYDTRTSRWWEAN